MIFFPVACIIFSTMLWCVCIAGSEALMSNIMVSVHSKSSILVDLF